ncbi:4Fe-4S cluster-binding domain-containing protein [Rodentibacter caecimuris]|uniref:Radical SAM protein n=1 Tax=Rodentibacter caecimuris TaxID=1796644 RepID=A0ABX3KY90_9PAST|nr:radical SAM protein [Rodentibacter heylii]
MTALSDIFVPLHRIIPFSNVEGQGNRTSIFLQGCKLNCLYCHNPETISRHTDGAKLVSLQYLYEQIMAAVPFIRGVTFSGGEPTIHHKKLVPLFQKLRKEGLTCYLDSSGFFDFEQIQPLIEVTDKFLFDLKGEGLGLQSLCFDRKNRHGRIPNQLIPDRQIIKQSNLHRNLYNLKKLLALNKVEEVRLVFVLNFFNAEKLIENTATLLKQHPNVLLKIIRVHSKGVRDEIGLQPHIPSTAQTTELEKYAKSCGISKIMTIY